MRALSIFIGYDSREHAAYEVCRASLLRRASRDVHLVKLDQLELRSIGLYSREWREVEGQRIDCIDGKPFSTDFTFTRFLVPVLTLRQGWALFCDCDFLFTADVAALFDLIDDRYAALVVKHGQYIPSESIKMDGRAQTQYHRKNWSSLVLWNCAHPKNRWLSPWAVNHMTGQYLHAFSWLEDDDIGELPHEWNHLVGVDPEPAELPCGLHYTLGIPLMAGYGQGPWADLWISEHNSRRSLRGNLLPSERVRALETRTPAYLAKG